MIQMHISRYTTDINLGTLSKVTFPGTADDVLDYLEPPWLANVPYKSCVPEGVYAGIYSHSPKFSGRSGRLYFLIGGTVVRNEAELKPPQATRWACIAGHPANWHQQLQGCGAFGLTCQMNHTGHPRHPEFGRSHYVGQSRKALARVKQILGGAPIIQVIIGWDL